MARQKFDGVVEVVHLKPDGQVDWVRAYLRRGAAFSDHIKLDRSTLVEQIKSGKRYLTGKRIPLMAGSFEVDQPLRVVPKNGKEVLVTGELQSEQDRLEGVPVI